MFTLSGTYPWSFLTEIFHNGQSSNDGDCKTFNLHLKIDSEERLRMKLYYKGDYFNFPIVNFSFISSNIPAPAYGVFISQLIQYFKAYGSIRISLLTMKLMNQGFVWVKLKSLLRQFYGRHHVLVDRYEISVSQITMKMFHFS